MYCEYNKYPRTEITERAVEGGISLAEYFIKQTEKIHSLLSEYSPLDDLPMNKQQLYEALPDTFKTAQGLALIDKFNIRKRTFNHFLNNKTLFKRTAQGEYEKLL